MGETRLQEHHVDGFRPRTRTNALVDGRRGFPRIPPVKSIAEGLRVLQPVRVDRGDRSTIYMAEVVGAILGGLGKRGIK